MREKTKSTARSQNQTHNQQQQQDTSLKSKQSTIIKKIKFPIKKSNKSQRRWLQELTKEVDDEAAIREAARGTEEVGLTIRRVLFLKAGGNADAGVGVRVPEAEESRVVEFNGGGGGEKDNEKKKEGEGDQG